MDDVEQIGDDGAGGGVGAGALAFEDGAAEEVAFDGDGVEHAVDAGQGVALGEQGGVDA